VTDIQITDQFQATSMLPAQPDRGVWSIVTIDVDRSGGPHDGRIYISYTDRASTATDDTNIFVRFSDDGGCNWSCAIQINDDGGTTSQFLPRLAVDQITGDVYAAWYDARNDEANNQQVDIFTAVSVNGGTSWGLNEQLTTAQSDESMNNISANPNNYAEYIGLAAFGGADFVGWTDARAANFTTGNNEEIFFSRASRAVEIADDNDKVVKGGCCDDILTRNDDANVLIAGKFDTLTGGKGPDTFLFRPDFGTNTIIDFDLHNDALQFDKSIFTSVCDHAADTARGAVVTDTHGDALALIGITVAQLQAHASDFHLV
jgi:hypothetical protein